MTKNFHYSGKIGKKEINQITIKKLAKEMKKLNEGDTIEIKAIKKPRKTRDTTLFKSAAEKAKKLVQMMDEKERKGTYKIFMGKILQKNDKIQLTPSQLKIWNDYENMKIVDNVNIPQIPQ